MGKSLRVDKKYILQEYKKYLKSFEGNFEKKVLNLLEDVYSEIEIWWDYRGIRYDTVMTQKQWDDFYNHKERRPYKSKTLKHLKSVDKKFDFTFEIFEDFYNFYTVLKNSDFKDKLKSSLSYMLRSLINAKYGTEMMRITDTYVDISKEDRDDGKINPTRVSISRLYYAIKEYCYLNDKDYKKLKDKIWGVCGGNSAILAEYFNTCDVEDTFCDQLRVIFRIFKSNLTLSFFDIKVGWKIWRRLNRIGLDVTKYLELNDYPKYEQIEKKLLEFQGNKKFITEILKHMEDELPRSYKFYMESGYVELFDIFREQAKRKKYPKKLRSQNDIDMMVYEVKEEIYKYLPLVKNPHPRNVLLNPTHPAATSRAFNSTVKNLKEQVVNTTVLTPRSDHKDRYLSTFAHEATHALHSLIVDLGISKGILKKGSDHTIPFNTKEDFSQLVEPQFSDDRSLPYKKKFKGKEFPDFMSGYAARFQVPYALTQLGIRKKFDEWIAEGTENLTDEMIWELKNEFDPKTIHWFSMGINFKSDSLNAFRFFSPNNPDDGLMYVKRYFAEGDKHKNKDSEKTKELTMENAFKEKFGNKWIENKDARTMLLWLMLESGRNHKSEDYYSFILNKDMQECLAELTRLGIGKNLI